MAFFKAFRWLYGYILIPLPFLSKAIRPLGGYGRIHCFLDNDKAGMEAVQELREEYGLRVRDASHIYGGYNDLNDFLRDKQNGQSEHQEQKPEPEKSQQKTEQPERLEVEFSTM